MAWRLNHSVVRGEIDNRKRGLVTGRIWLFGREMPITLELEGNCLSDLAGTRFTFTNPSPVEGEPTGLAEIQRGKVGDITASRKVRDVSASQISRIMRSGTHKIPTGKLANALYLEWYSQFNGRVVVESIKYEIKMGERVWSPSSEEEASQQTSNQENIFSWLDELTDRFEAADETDSADDQSMDEFEWERFMRESDARADKFSKLFEKYIEHPERDRIIAREMGWIWLEEMLDAEEEDEEGEGGFSVDGNWSDDIPDLVPNPLTEGKDWVRNEHGHVEHPLTMRAHKLGIDMWKYTEEKGYLGEEGSEDVREMVFKTQTTAAKLAGALNHLAYEQQPDGGFIVAALKRALNYLHEALSAAGRVCSSDNLELEHCTLYQNEMFDIRQEILKLMQYYRQAI